MSNLLNEIKHDLNFLRSHTLQPKWYKILKAFILMGFLAGYFFVFGLAATIVFLVIFFCLMLVVHFIYRIKTDRFTKNWLDFIVVNDGEQKPKRIGKYYYPAIVVNVMLAFMVSLVVA